MGEEFQRAWTKKRHREAGKHKNIDHESKFHCSKKSNICLKKKFVQRGSPEKKIPAQAVSEKKIRDAT